MHRRGVLRVGLTGALWLGLSRAARATLGRGASIDVLVAQSRHVLVGEALDAYSTWEQIGTRKHIVTYTRIKPSELLAGADPAQDASGQLGQAFLWDSHGDLRDDVGMTLGRGGWL